MYIHSRDSVSTPGPLTDGPGVFTSSSVSHVIEHAPIGPISSTNAKHHDHHQLQHDGLIAWLVRTLSVLFLISDAVFFPAPSTTTISSASSSPSKRDLGPNATTSIVAGVLVSVFVICVGVFFCIYGKSIRVRRKRHRHRNHRRASGTSKMSQVSEAGGGGAGGAGGGAGGAGGGRGGGGGGGGPAAEA
ncbi:hypothetical protein GGR50DRAFT_656149 [Xylaria sp. CBS 124048]|nr:hypothetical protein GGR50DRAFT_656149 [Xylaria sp. CBS 124048]